MVALERSLTADDVRADRAAVSSLLHPEWAEIGRSGRWWSRAEFLDAVRPLPEPVDLEVISVNRVDAQSILLIWRASTAGRSTLRSSLWVRDRGAWRQRFHQGTDEP